CPDRAGRRRHHRRRRGRLSRRRPGAGASGTTGSSRRFAMSVASNNGQSASRIHFGEREGVSGGRDYSAPLLDDAAVRSAESWTAQEILGWALDRFHPRIAFASSFGVEDVALIHMLWTVRRDARVFTLDTGRLPAETYAVMER